MIDSRILLIVPVLSLIGSGRYVWHVLQGKAKPNRVTWFLWALAPMIAFAAELKEGVDILQTLVTFMAGFGPLLILIASFIGRKAAWKITRFDITCGVLSLCGLALWMITRHGNVAIIFSIVADGLAALPTIVKAYKDPESESYFVFALGATSSLLTLLTVKEWTLANVGFPIYLCSVCIVLVLLIRFKLGTRRLATEDKTY